MSKTVIINEFHMETKNWFICLACVCQFILKYKTEATEAMNSKAF